MILDEEEIRARLLSDLSILGMPMNEVDLYIRPYSKTFYGKYYPVYVEEGVKPRVFLYPYEKNGDMIDYDTIFSCGGIHEMCHHLEFTDPSWVRLKGVAHDPKFWKLYSYYVDKAKRYGLIGGVDLEEKGIEYQVVRTNQRCYNSGVVLANS